MKEDTQNKIYDNIRNLNTIVIVDNFTDIWIRQQLINKQNIYLRYLRESFDLDMDKFYPIVKLSQIEVDELILRWS